MVIRESSSTQYGFSGSQKNRTNGNPYYQRNFYGINWYIGDLRNQKYPFCVNFYEFSMFERDKNNSEDHFDMFILLFITIFSYFCIICQFPVYLWTFLLTLCFCFRKKNAKKDFWRFSILNFLNFLTIFKKKPY